MILTEEHTIRKRAATRELYHRIDTCCYQAKNLHNTVNYRISQCSRISRKLAAQSELEEWEDELLRETNEAIRSYNAGRPGRKPLKPINAENGYLTDAYFLSWYLKSEEVYREMPYATCAQICIQEVCRNWKSYLQGRKSWGKDPSAFTGCPKKPGYLDKEKGRAALVITSQNLSVDERGYLCLPKFLRGIRIRPRHEGIRQIRITSEPDRIHIRLLYEKKEAPEVSPTGVMGIDTGVNNLLTVCMNTGASPFLISGRPVKSVNRYYNKRKSELQSAAKKGNKTEHTKRMDRLTARRNRKIRDHMHKASRAVVNAAKENGIGTIVIGSNRGWKQEVSLGNRTNQNFVSIPHRTMIEMIRYKAELEGIRVVEVEESYTSGTSFLDHEPPEKAFYNKKRRIHRGLFRSEQGILINADVNAAYQIMKKAGYDPVCHERIREVRKIKVA